MIGFSSKIKSQIRGLINSPGWRTNRKIIVFESDDWGSIRMPSAKVYNKLLEQGYPVDKQPFNKYDTLESEQDLACLFETLTKFRDKNNHHPIITANNIVGNPDFKKIEASGFQEYNYEPFTETYKKYPGCQNSLDIFKQGIQERVIWPQLHGREHVNVSKWLLALRNNDQLVRTAFKHRMISIHAGKLTPKHNYMDTCAFQTPEELAFIENSIDEGAQLFEDIWGFKSESFIASCYVWSPSIESTLKRNGVSVLQGVYAQHVPVPGKEKNKRILHYTGQKNKYGQTYLVRNAFFEPSLTEKRDVVDLCLKEIGNAFFWKKPAIIGCHRLNFIGSIDPNNRNNNLRLMNELLSRMLKKWPNIEFMTSDELGRLIYSTKTR